jgi:HlyD family type I secretion membrane fusion protein
MNTLALPHPAADARRVMRAGSLIIVLAFGLLGAWASLAPLMGAVIASGVVKVENNRKTVQHLEGGIVKEILVQDGDHVQAGQPLIIIRDAKIDAQLMGASAQLEAEMAKAARLQAERDGLSAIAFPIDLTNRRAEPRVAQLLRVETSLFETKRHALKEQLQLIQSQTREIRQEMEGLNAQAQAGRSALDLLNQEIEANEKLQKLNFISKMQVLKLHRNREEYQSRQGESLAALAKARQKITELEMRGANLRNQYQQAAADELAIAQSRTVDLSERVKPSQDAVKRQAITAPIAGTVVALKVFTVGGVVAPGAPLLDIVPEEDTLIIEARVNVDDIQHVHPGIPADIRFTAYPTRSTPLVMGELKYVSADRLTDKDTGASYYLAQVRVDQDSIAAATAVKLQPGLRAEVFLKTGERTALDYLLEPISSSLRRALRES